jgi:hypothetical protein
VLVTHNFPVLNLHYRGTGQHAGTGDCDLHGQMDRQTDILRQADWRTERHIWTDGWKDGKIV